MTSPDSDRLNDDIMHRAAKGENKITKETVKSQKKKKSFDETQTFHIQIMDQSSNEGPDGIFRDEENATTPYQPMEQLPYNLDEDSDDMSLQLSITSSVLTADGIHDTVGFSIICLVILIGDMARGIMFPSLWPLVSSLGGSSVTLGYTVAAFSFGRILVSPLFGTWSITHGYTKTLLVSCSILLLGTFAYTQVQNVGRPEFLILSQMLLGFGSGTLGVTRAFVAEVTATRSRTTYMAWITAVQYAGFTVTPFLGALFSKILKNVDIQSGYV